METATETQQTGPDLGQTYRRSVRWWAQQSAGVADDQWDAPTPCTRLDRARPRQPRRRRGPLDRPADARPHDRRGRRHASTATSSATTRCGAAPGRRDGGDRRWSPRLLPRDGTVHLSYGEEQMDEYVHQLAADHLVHAWDLAAATGGDTHARPRPRRRGGGVVRRAEHPTAASASSAPRGVSRGGAQSRPARGLRARCRVGTGARRAGGVLGGVRARRRRRDHGADDRRLRVRGHGTRTGRRSATRARRRPRRVGVALHRDARARPSPRRSRSSRATGGAALALRLGGRRRRRPATCAASTSLRLRDGKVCEKLSYVKG